MYDYYIWFVTSWLFWIPLGCVFVLMILQHAHRPQNRKDSHIAAGPWVRRNYWAVMVGFGLMLGGFAAVFYLAEIGWSVIALVDRLRAAAYDTTAENEEAIRNLAFGVAVLLGAMAAATTLIFQLVKVWTTERVTTATEEGLTTDRINKAVEGLGAEKEINRLGRQITVKPADGSEHINEFEWQDDLFKPQADEDVIERGDWQSIKVTLPNLEVRIGAIFALERISQDSPRDHVQIMEILCAYIRENAPADQAETFPEPDWWPLHEDASENLRNSHVANARERFSSYSGLSKAYDWAANLEPRTDIQIAIRVIGRRTKAQIKIERRDSRHGENGYQLDLRNSNFQGCG